MVEGTVHTHVHRGEWGGKLLSRVMAWCLVHWTPSHWAQVRSLSFHSFFTRLINSLHTCTCTCTYTYTYTCYTFCSLKCSAGTHPFPWVARYTCTVAVHPWPVLTSPPIPWPEQPPLHAHTWQSSLPYLK